MLLVDLIFSSSIYRMRTSGGQYSVRIGSSTSGMCNLFHRLQNPLPQMKNHERMVIRASTANFGFILSTRSLVENEVLRQSLIFVFFFLFVFQKPDRVGNWSLTADLEF